MRDHCAVSLCTDETETILPLPLCRRHGIETALAILPAALGRSLAEISETGETEPPTAASTKVSRAYQDAVTVALYLSLNRRPEWTDIRDALTSAGLAEVSRPTAQRIRERVEGAHPELTSERPAPTAND